MRPYNSSQKYFVYANLAPVSKLADVQTTIFTVMSALAERHSAIVCLGVFPISTVLQVAGAGAALFDHGFNQYPPMAGVQSLREAIADKVADLYALQCSADAEITVTAGATEALFCAIAAVVNPDDEVILFDPSYDSYDPVIRLQGGVPVHCRFLRQSIELIGPWSAMRSQNVRV